MLSTSDRSLERLENGSHALIFLYLFNLPMFVNKMASARNMELAPYRNRHRPTYIAAYGDVQERQYNVTW